MLRTSPLVVILIAQLAATLPAVGQTAAADGPSAYRQLAGKSESDNSHTIKLAAHEQAISQTAHDETIKAGSNPRELVTDESRRLTPPRLARPSDSAGKKSETLLERFRLPRGSTASTVAALAVVTGLLLLAMWGLKRSLPASMQLLPADAARVVGRMHITGKQFAHLVKLGDKLVLISITPAGVDTLTEISEPDQVMRLLALCASDSGHSLKRDFDHILKQISAEPAHPGFLGQDTLASAARGGYRRA